jgi:hypothetical protein
MNFQEVITEHNMRIKYQGEEYQISGLRPKGNTIVAGRAVGDNGKLREGVEDITDYDENGVERIPEPPQYQAEEESEIMLEIE